MHVFVKDRLQQPEKIMEQIIIRIKEEPVAEILATEEINVAGAALTETFAANEPTIIQPLTTATAVLPGFENVPFERLVFTDTTCSKFWEAAVQENKLIVRYGRVGTKGQVQIKAFEDRAKAEKEKEKLLKEKITNGYKLT